MKKTYKTMPKGQKAKYGQNMKPQTEKGENWKTRDALYIILNKVELQGLDRGNIYNIFV